jgi:hypothetical protein
MFRLTARRVKGIPSRCAGAAGRADPILGRVAEPEFAAVA